MAAADLKEATKRAARSRFHMVVNQLQALRRIRRQIEAAPDPARALKSLLEFSVDSGHKGESVRFLAESYEAFMRADLQHFLRRTGLDVAGRSRNKALLFDVVRELHGEATGSDEAADLAKGVARAYERMRQLFNAHGGDIGKLEGFGLPHRHDAREIARGLRQVGRVHYAETGLGSDHRAQHRSRLCRCRRVTGRGCGAAVPEGGLRQHNHTRVDGKAMVVCMSRRICVALYDQIIALRPDWHSDDDSEGVVKSVMTGLASGPKEWQAHGGNKARRDLQDRKPFVRSRATSGLR